MIISEKAIRMFAKTLLFETDIKTNINELNMSPSTGPGANDEFKNSRHFYNVPGPMISGDGKYPASYPVEHFNDENVDDNIIPDETVSNIKQHTANYSEIEPNSIENLLGVIKFELDAEIGMNLSKDKISKLEKDIKKIIREIL